MEKNRKLRLLLSCMQAFCVGLAFSWHGDAGYTASPLSPLMITVTA